MLQDVASVHDSVVSNATAKTDVRSATWKNSKRDDLHTKMQSLSEVLGLRLLRQQDILI